MLLSLILFALGLIILIKGADLLVEGASSAAFKFKIPPIVIGLTVVAFGTSAPEMVVSISSALAGNSGVAFGNIVGSNIANILLILGASAMIYPLAVHKNTIWKEIPFSFLAAVILTILGLQYLFDENKLHQVNLFSNEIIGHISFSDGLILLSFFIIFLYYTFGISKATSDSAPEIKELSFFKSIILIIAGLLALVIGSKLTVDNAISIAHTLGVSDVFIGLTIVAIGTSLPELVTSIVAALKKQVDIAVGNVVGSNIFNVFLILGLTSLFKEIPLSGVNLLDILVLFFATILLFLALFVHKKHRIGQVEGILMLVLYVGYIIFLLFREMNW